MKISYIANVRIPTSKAHGLQIVKMCESFANLGNNVELILPTRKNPELPKVDLFDYYRVKKNFLAKKISCWDPLFLAKLRNGIYIKTQTIFFIMSLCVFFLKKNNRTTDIIYVRDEYLLPFILKFNLPVVWEAHNLPRHRKRYLKHFNRCKKIIAITDGLKKDLTSIGVNSSIVMVSPDGVDLSEFTISDDKIACRRRLNFDKDRKLVMYAGHLFDWKGVHTLADSAKYLTDSTIVFVGGTTDDQLALRKFVQKEQIANVMFIDQQPHELIPYYLKAADVLVLPNSAKKEISAKYTSPLKLFEYMSVGRPIVASNLPSLREILDDASAVLVEPDSSFELAEGVKKIIESNELGEQLARNCLERVKQYGWNKRATNIVAALNIT